MRHCTRFLIAVCLALSAGAQNVVNRIEVELRCDPPLPKDISLIVYGEDRAPLALTETNGIYVRDLTAAPLRVENLIASVRMGDRRTGCMKYERLNRNATGYTAFFSFRCPDEDTWSGLRVEPVDRSRIAYVRIMSADEDLGTVACLQEGAFTGGSIKAVLPESESIFLHVGAVDPNASFTTWHMLIENGRYAKRPVGRHTRNLGRATIASEYVIRRGRPSARNAAAMMKSFSFPKQFEHLTLDRSD